MNFTERLPLVADEDTGLRIESKVAIWELKSPMENDDGRLQMKLDAVCV